TPLTSGAFEVEYVSLSPRRTTVVFNSNEGDVDRRHVWAVPAAGGRPSPPRPAVPRSSSTRTKATSTGGTSGPCPRRAAAPLPCRRGGGSGGGRGGARAG